MTTPKPARKPADWKKIKAALKEDAGGLAFAVAGLGMFLVGWTWGGNTQFNNAMPLAWSGIGLALVAIGFLQVGATSVRKLRVRLEALEELDGIKPSPVDDDDASPPAATDAAAPSDAPPQDDMAKSTDSRGAKGA